MHDDEEDAGRGCKDTREYENNTLAVFKFCIETQ